MGSDFLTETSAQPYDYFRAAKMMWKHGDIVSLVEAVYGKYHGSKCLDICHLHVVRLHTASTEELPNHIRAENTFVKNRLRQLSSTVLCFKPVVWRFQGAEWCVCRSPSSLLWCDGWVFEYSYVLYRKQRVFLFCKLFSVEWVCAFMAQATKGEYDRLGPNIFSGD